MTEQIKTKESRLKGLLKSLGVIALVLILFFGMQFVVTVIAMVIGLTDMMLKGEVPLDFIYYPDLVDDVLLALEEKALTEVHGSCNLLPLSKKLSQEEAQA